mmetsp:Transcript_3223/g.6672  ORF Transcript_3223/g.6672 Transcript_3223/m.6672 type:complete len:128 (+) Transcript_3223:258-641(+)
MEAGETEELGGRALRKLRRASGGPPEKTIDVRAHADPSDKRDVLVRSGGGAEGHSGSLTSSPASVSSPSCISPLHRPVLICSGAPRQKHKEEEGDAREGREGERRFRRGVIQIGGRRGFTPATESVS